MNCFNDNDIGGAMAGAATMAAGAGFKEEIGKSPLTRIAIFDRGLQSLVASIGEGCTLQATFHME